MAIRTRLCPRRREIRRIWRVSDLTGEIEHLEQRHESLDSRRLRVRRDQESYDEMRDYQRDLRMAENEKKETNTRTLPAV